MSTTEVAGVADAVGAEPTSTESTSRLTLETARELFDAMSSDGEPDFSLIERYYHPDVRFQDPIQQVEGHLYESLVQGVVEPAHA